MIERRIIRVQGTVQGIFYRASARDEAQRRGLHGFARNESDGSVYIEAEGEPAQLNDFVAWCWRGPDKAAVSAVEVEPGEPVGHQGFTTY